MIEATKCREIELKFGYGALYRLLVELQEKGEIRATSVEVIAPMILGALIEAANGIAGTAVKNRAASLAAARDVITRFLNCLRS